MEAVKSAPRKLYIDFIKIIAIYMVLFNHTRTDGFVIFTVARYSLLYPLYLLLAVFIKIAVPLFFMCSGTLLLGKEESYKDLLVKRFLKFALLLLAASAIIMYVDGQLSVSLKEYLKKVFIGPVSVQLWYLYSYLAFLLMLPILRKLAVAMTGKEYQWMFAMVVLINLATIIEFFLWQDRYYHYNEFTFFAATNYVFYPLIGYYIDAKLTPDHFNRKNLTTLIVAGVSALLITGIATHLWCTITDGWNEYACQKFINNLIMLPATVVFYAAKMWFQNHNVSPRTAKFIQAAGGTTFGIYLLEPIFREKTYFVFRFLKPYAHVLPACLIWIAVACVAGAVFIYFVKKIPGVNRYI